VNVIGIMLDSLRQDHLGCYGNDWIETPNLDGLAKESVVFDNAYPEGLPTIPVRTQLWTGQCTLAFRPWQPLAKEDVTGAEILRAHGYLTALIADTYHIFKPDMNFHRGFDVFRWIRGQEADAYRSGPADRNLDDFVTPGMADSRTARMLEQYLKNTTGRKGPDDYFPAQVMNEAIRWLEANRHNEPFFLWVDSFDPHEPWDPPPPYDTQYMDPSYKGKKLLHPKYGEVDWMTEEELKAVRALYAGEVSFVDAGLGKLLDKMKELRLDRDTLVVVLSDHGHPHGDHGKIMKSDDNLYSELLRIPLLIRHPEGAGAGQRIEALVQTQDVLPTILDLLGIPPAVPMHGESLWPLVTGQRQDIRDHIVSGYHPSQHRVVRDKEWSFILRPEGEADELYNLVHDPKEKENVIEKHPDIAKRLRAKLGRYARIVHGDVRKLTIQLKHEISYTPAEKPTRGVD